VAVLITRLHAAISAVCPIDGLAVQPTGDPPVVRIDYAGSATADQRTAALAALAGFDWSDAAQSAWEVSRGLTAGVAAIQSPDLTDVTTAGINLVLQVIGTRVNDAFRAMGREPPLLQLDVINDVRALIGLPPLVPP
jgi:hypothetical protein